MFKSKTILKLIVHFDMKKMGFREVKEMSLNLYFPRLVSEVNHFLLLVLLLAVFAVIVSLVVAIVQMIIIW